MMKNLFIFTALLAFALSAKAQTVIQLNLGTQPARLTVNAGDDMTIKENGQATLQATASGGTATYRYLWTPATGLSNTAIENPVASPTDTTAYVVMATDQRLCTAYDTVVVNVGHKTGLARATSGNIRVYPNPVTKYFYVSLDTQGQPAEVSLFTIDGKEAWKKVVESGSLNSTRFEIEGNGSIYLLKVVSGETLITKTLVVSQK